MQTSCLARYQLQMYLSGECITTFVRVSMGDGEFFGRPAMCCFHGCRQCLFCKRSKLMTPFSERGMSIDVNPLIVGLAQNQGTNVARSLLCSPLEG